MCVIELDPLPAIIPDIFRDELIIGKAKQESATALLIDLNGIKPKEPRTSTGVAYFRTNSTGQFAFLNNTVAIYQVKVSPVGTAIKYWEWKGANLPFGAR